MAEHPANPQTTGQKAEVVVGDDASRHIIAEQRTQLWSGPLPSPEDFSAYPQAAQDFILNAAKDEGNHRRGIEAKVLDANIAHGNRGQNYAFIVAMASLLISGFLVYNGRDYWGAITMLGILPALVPQIENLLKALFGGDKKGNGDNKQQQNDGHSD